MVEGYGRQTRNKGPISVTNRRVATGVSTVYHSNTTEQETVSFRNVVAGTPVLEKDIDPYGYLHKLVAKRKLADNGSKELLTPIKVDGRVVSYAPVRDDGHCFLTRNREWTTSVREGYHYYAGVGQFAGGPYYARNCTISAAASAKMLFPMSGTGGRTFGSLPMVPLQDDLVDFGKRALVVLAPGFPDVSLFVTIGELLAAFPKFIGKSMFEQFFGHYTRNNGIDTFGKVSKGASAEFLNYVFGVLPTFKDAAAIVDAMNRATNTLLQLERDSGLGISRKMTFDIDTKSAIFPSGELSDQGSVSTGSSTFLYGGQKSSTSAGAVRSTSLSSSLTQQSIRKVSFSGNFSRFLPTQPGLANSRERFMRDFNLVYGTEPNFDRLWQLIPFSWLVDWFTDIQLSMRLLDRVHDKSLVVNYGYVMGLTRRSVIQRTELTYEPAYTASFSSVSTMHTSVIKQRVRANFSGFIPPDEVEINPLRVAIGIALGISGKKPN